MIFEGKIVVQLNLFIFACLVVSEGSRLRIINYAEIRVCSQLEMSVGQQVSETVRENFFSWRRSNFTRRTESYKNRCC